MGESNFVLKVEAACQKKEELYTASKARYAVRSMFAGAFLTMSTAVGIVGADLLNTFLPGSGRFLFPFIFAWGLVYLLFLNSELTTSNMMYLTAGVYLKKINWKKAIEILLYCTFFNLVGALFLAFLFSQTSAFANLNPKGFLGNEHIAANFASFSLATFNSISKDLPHLEFFNVLRHYAVTFVGNWVGGGVIMGLAYAWLNRTKTIYKD